MAAKVLETSSEREQIGEANNNYNDTAASDVQTPQLSSSISGTEMSVGDTPESDDGPRRYRP